MKKSVRLIISIAVCEAIGLAATPFTISVIPTWYATLNKPSFSPPNWIFGPVWTILYLLMGVAAYLIWEKGLKNKKTKIALIYFLIQLVFNFFWSVFFFGLRQPLLAFIDIIFLWLAIVITMLKFYKLSKTAFYLLVPYLLWVSFATILNFSIVVLNI
jgi:benzodiazapine receptor